MVARVATHRGRASSRRMSGRGGRTGTLPRGCLGALPTVRSRPGSAGVRTGARGTSRILVPLRRGGSSDQPHEALDAARDRGRGVQEPEGVAVALHAAARLAEALHLTALEGEGPGRPPPRRRCRRSASRRPRRGGANSPAPITPTVQPCAWRSVRNAFQASARSAPGPIGSATRGRRRRRPRRRRGARWKNHCLSSRSAK